MGDPICLYLPRDWEGEVPDSYFIFRSPTYTNLMFWRGFLVDGDPGPAIDGVHQHLKVDTLGAKADAADIRTTRPLVRQDLAAG